MSKKTVLTDLSVNDRRQYLSDYVEDLINLEYSYLVSFLDSDVVETFIDDFRKNEDDVFIEGEEFHAVAALLVYEREVKNREADESSEPPWDCEDEESKDDS